MATFRIIKIETTDGLGETETRYKIQKKFLFWFFDHKTLTHYWTQTNWNQHPSNGAMLTKRIFIFKTEEQAREYLNKIENPFKEIYKGNTIIRVVNDRTWKDVYINKGHYRYWHDGNCYEYSYDLKDLKAEIDRRTTTTTITKL